MPILTNHNSYMHLDKCEILLNQGISLYNHTFRCPKMASMTQKFSHHETYQNPSKPDLRVKIPAQGQVERGLG